MLAGVNLQAIDGPGDTDLYLGNHMVYDPSAAYLPELRSRVPDTLIILRAIEGVNSFWGDPERTARQCNDLVRQFPQADRLCPANEQNHEFNADSGAIAAWCRRFRAEWNRLGYRCPLVTPAVSTGKPFDLGALRDEWSYWDFIGVHAYATLSDLEFNAAKAHIQAHHQAWPTHRLSLTEYNIDKLQETTYRHQEGANAVSNFLNWLVAYQWVDVAQWFLKQAAHDDQPYEMVKIQPLLSLHRQIGHQASSGSGGGNVVPPPVPPNAEIARIEAKYNISHRDTDKMYLAELIERPDPPAIAAYGPADATVLVSTADNLHQGRGPGYAETAFSHPAAYFPTQGQKGFFYAECEGARVDGLGWAFGIPGDTAPHRNVAVKFARRDGGGGGGGGGGIGPGPTPPPSTGYTWSGAFADYAAAHPEVGQPVGQIVYLPQIREPWPCAAQISMSHVLVWPAGAPVVAIKRADAPG